MERYQWMLLFERKDGKPNEEIYFTDEESARKALPIYNERVSADLYQRICLVRVDWFERTEEVQDSLSF